MSEYIEKQAITGKWIDLDDLTYDNHFTNGQCFIAVDFGNQRYASYNLPVYPEDITFNFQTNYEDANIIGRPGKISAYTGTDDIKTSFQLHLHRELVTYNNELKDVNEIDYIISLIQAAAYPLINPGNGLFAPITTYKFGDTLMVGKQNSVSVKYSGPKINGSYMEAILNVSFTIVPEKILHYESVKNNSNPRSWG